MKRRRCGWGAMATLALILSGCAAASSIADRMNPANLFDRGPGEAESESAAIARERAASAVEETADEPYPSLSSVPERPEIVSRRDVQRGLVADRANAAHTGSVLRESGAAIPGPMATPSRGQQTVQQITPEATGPLPDAAEMAALQERLSVGEAVRAGVIRFAENAYDVPAEERVRVARIAELALATSATVVVVGHASPPTGRGTAEVEEANLRVSLDRANAVADLLAGLGVDRARIVVQGKGDNEPEVVDNGPAAAAANRRAEIFLRE